MLVRIAAAAPNGPLGSTSVDTAAASPEVPAAATDPPVVATDPPVVATDPPVVATTARPPADATTTAPIEPVDWWALLAQLDRARAAALAAREVPALDSYAVPDSPAWTQDALIIADLEARGLAPVGLTTRLVGIERVPEAADLGPDLVAELVIVDDRSAYSLVDDQGVVVEEVPASGLRRWQVRLTGAQSGGGGLAWRLLSVEPVA